MKKLLVALLLLISAPALAQVKQSGSVTPTHAVCWTTNGIIQDCGTAAIPYLSTFGVVGSGPSLCQSSGAITGPYNQLCFAATGTGGGFSWTSFGGATGSPTFNINGTIYQFPYVVGGIVGPATTVSGNLACWNNTVGTLLKDCGIAIGTPTANDLLYFSSSTQISALATANNSVLGTNGSGVPSLSTTLPSGLTVPAPTVTTSFTATGLVTLADLATQATNTVLANVTSGTASPTAFAVSACSALSWITNTGFGCTTDFAKLDAAQSYTAAQRGTPTNIAISTATFTPNFNTAQNFEIDLGSTCPCTLANPSTSLVAGQSGMIEIHQDGSGSRVISTWGTDYLATGATSGITLSTAAGAVDYMPYYVNNAATGIVLGGLTKAPSH